jgi:enediyne biosynthesis protein E5
VGTAYLCELGTELAINGWARARFRASAAHAVAFLLPAHITGLAVGMLLYTNQRFVVVVFAVAVAIFSKVLLRVTAPGGAPGATTHFMNPSNLGIAVTLLVFSDWVGVAQPYQFTENVSGMLDWILPLLIVCSGSFLNWRATRRLPLVLSWLAGFILQATARAWLAPQDMATLLAPMTGLAFVLFTFYMISDPMTTPRGVAGQVLFGFGTALLYGVLTHAGIVFGLFFSLCLSCALRGAWLWLAPRSARFSVPRPVWTSRLASPK